MRPSSVPLAQALIEGLTAAGLDVIDIGLATTPMNYFAIGHLKTAGGAQVTASHNPAQYNGLKFSKHEARPVSGDHGIALLETCVKNNDLPASTRPGTVSTADVSAEYAKHVLSFLRRPAGAAGSRHRPSPQGRRRRLERHGGRRSRDLGRPRPRSRAALLRARRLVPQSRGEPAQAREPARPAGQGPRGRRRPRRLLRRRLRPRGVHRRARRTGRQRSDDRAHRRRAPRRASPAST